MPPHVLERWQSVHGLPPFPSSLKSGWFPPVSPAAYLGNYLTTRTLRYLLLDTYRWDFPSDKITLPRFQAYYRGKKGSLFLFNLLVWLL